MFGPMLTPGTVIDELGGTGKVASSLGLEDSTVSGWRTRGIPPARWPALVRLATERGVEGLTFEVLAGLPEQVEARA